MTIDVWGVIGLCSFAVAFASEYFLRFHDRMLPDDWNGALLPRIALVSAIALPFLIFLRLPHEAGYLIPAIPFILLSLAHYLRPQSILAFSIMLLLSPFFVGFTRTNPYLPFTPSTLSIERRLAGQPLVLDVLNGPIWIDRMRRKSQIAFIEYALERSRVLPKPSIILCGEYLPLLAVEKPGDFPDDIQFVYTLDSEKILEANAQRKGVYYIPPANRIVQTDWDHPPDGYGIIRMVIPEEFQRGHTTQRSSTP